MTEHNKLNSEYLNFRLLMLQNLTTELQTRVPGRATSHFSQSPEAKCLIVASGDRAPLEHCLELYDHMQSVLVDRESLNLSLDRNFRFSTFNLTL